MQQKRNSTFCFFVVSSCMMYLLRKTYSLPQYVVAKTSQSTHIKQRVPSLIVYAISFSTGRVCFCLYET
jgi:hypothetical protein